MQWNEGDKPWALVVDGAVCATSDNLAEVTAAFGEMAEAMVCGEVWAGADVHVCLRGDRLFGLTREHLEAIYG